MTNFDSRNRRRPTTYYRNADRSTDENKHEHKYRKNKKSDHFNHK